jgi:hypothetical protein
VRSVDYENLFHPAVVGFAGQRAVVDACDDFEDAALSVSSVRS